MKAIEQDKARVMRQEGRSVREIAKELNVSQGSVSLWVRDIELTPDQIAVLTARNPIYNRQYAGAKKRREDARLVRIECRKDGSEMAKKKEWLHAFGCALYWGEGAKDRVDCSLSNSDPYLLKVWMQFLRQYFPDHGITAYLHCYTGNGVSVEEQEDYWSKTLNIPKECFRKTVVNAVSKASLHKKATNTLTYGTLNITVVKGMRVVQHIYGALEEYGNVPAEFGLD